MEKPKSHVIIMRLLAPLAVLAVGKLLEAPKVKGALEEVDARTFVAEDYTCANVIAELRGTSDEIVILGAHYDTVDESPGADDNASGVAALLALARTFAHTTPRRTIRFVAFANEEPPYFMTEWMGSYQYAQRCHQRGEKVVAMLSLESLGYFRDEAGSQQYPASLEHVYPTTANFIAFASNLGSRGLLRDCIDVFRAHATIPSEGGALPEAVPGVAWPCLTEPISSR